MFDIRSLTWDEWSYPEGVILPIVTLGTIRHEDSGAARNATSFIIKLYSETQVSGRLGMSGGISPRHAQNPLSGERRKTLSITHHALSPPPSHHHLYMIHLINWLQRFYRIIMSLKRPFVPKSDVKQWFTTTTCRPIQFTGSTSACMHGTCIKCIRVLGWLLVVVLFAPIRGGSLGSSFICWMLCTALYGSTSLQQSSKGSCSLLVSGHNLWADCQWRTLVPPLNSGANAAPASVLALM